MGECSYPQVRHHDPVGLADCQCKIAPSVTPLTNLNSGFRVYEVDSGVRYFMLGASCDQS